ncbi:retinaldehyde-binding protein 1-like [Adelges cooleyi]|uniref:retinaldehyde-binding protein 1-like n=1 Tax=Adelges cooleyi TaxID=133065 RepID=UPI00217FB48E|nr:retinaldehyde-binding protein 1-like [Adelges cooleyi]
METKTLILPKLETISEIYTELGTSETKLEQDVKILKEWMRKQPHLPDPDDDEKKVDEKRIKNILLTCKNSLEKTKAVLDGHYTIKRLVPEYFSNWDPTAPELIQSIQQSCYFPFPKPTHEGNRVSLYCVRDGYTDGKYVHGDVNKLCFMTLDLRIGKLDTFKKEIIIMDYKNTTMNQIAAALPNIKKVVESAQAAFPLRAHSIHVINTTSFVQPLLNLMLSLLKKKINERVFIHKSVEDLKNYIDPSVLPLNFGGTYPKTSDEMIADWQDELIKHREWFLIQSSIVADNSKRPKNSRNSLDHLENTITGGSFRKLDVD